MREVTKTIVAEQAVEQKAQAKIVGSKMSIYHCCIMFNVPYILGVNASGWEDYIKRIGDKALDRYADGETDIYAVLKDISSDEERWIKEWGKGDDSHPYTTDDYRRLDEIFRNYSSRLQRAGGMDALQDDTLHNCSVMRLQVEKCIVKADKESTSIASTLNKMIQDNLSAEQLRRKDAMPADEMRIDGIVDALRKKYGVSVEMSKTDVLNLISRWMVSHHYNMTMDAAEHMLLAIINTTRRNNDESELTELPKRAKFNAALAGEFESIPNATELEAYDYLDIPVPKVQDDDDDTEQQVSDSGSKES